MATADKPIRALIDSLEKIPAEKFGNGQARILRKLLLVAIAKFADADGSNAMPGIETLARICLVSKRTIYRNLEWLRGQGLLTIECKAGRHGCNRYTILFSQNSLENKGDRQSTVPQLCHSDSQASHSDTLGGTLPSLYTEKRYDTPIASAQRAYREFQTQSSFTDQDALNLVKWVLYRAAHPSDGSQGEIPQTLEYYRKAGDNFLRQHEHRSTLDFAGERFDTYARVFLSEKAPDLLDWIEEKELELDELPF